MKIILCLLAFVIVNSFAQDPLETNVFNYFIPQVRPTILQQPTPLQIRWLSILMNSAWESWSQYTPVSKGFFVGDSLRRPVAERTLRNKNTAVAYSFHTLLRHYFPTKNSTWDVLMAGLGLPVNDGTNRNPATPMGLSNLCMEKVLNFFSHDGWNSLGDMNGRLRNRVPYEDYTGYEPENSPYDSDINPDRWQPQFVTDSTYFIREQTFVVPQAGVAETFAIDVDDRAYDVARIRDSWKRNRNGYTANVEQILQESRNLNDRKKMVVEWFDDKFASLGTLTRFVAGQDLDRFIIIETLVNNAFMDGVSLMWFHKPKFDAVRPVTAVRWLKKNQDVVAWGGPAQGTITLKGKDWRPYLNTDAHPEYPSGTTCLCTLFAQVVRKYNGNDLLNFTITFPTGTSLMEPGLTPQSAVSVTYTTLTEMATECANSRNWGGVHFRQSIDEAARVCPLVGDAVYNKFVKYLNGAADATPRTLCNDSGHGHGHGHGHGNGNGHRDD